MSTPENINNVFDKIEKDCYFEIEPIRKTKEDKKFLISKISELLTADDMYTSDVNLSEESIEIIFRVNKSETVSFEDLISVYEITDNIESDFRDNVNVNLAAPSRSSKSLKDALLTYRELDLKITSIYIYFRNC